LSANIDWISTTYPHDIQSKWRSVVLPLEAHSFIEAKAHNGYKEAYRHSSGAIVQRNEERPDMGIHVTYPASAIASVEQEFGVTQKELLNYLMLGSRLTRLDVAFNVAGVPIDIEQLFRDVRSGVALTKARTTAFIRSGDVCSEKNADTCYVGSMKKRKKLLRIYDKGMELGLDTPLTRFELETHGAIACSCGTILAARELNQYPKTIASLIAGYVDFSETHVGQYFDGEIRLATPTHARGDTAKWLLDVVAPTLARQMVADVGIWFDFKDAVQAAYNETVGAKEGAG